MEAPERKRSSTNRSLLQMNLIPKKCKEIRHTFLAKDLDVFQLTVNDTYLEKVSVRGK